MGKGKRMCQGWEEARGRQSYKWDRSLGQAQGEGLGG